MGFRLGNKGEGLKSGSWLLAPMLGAVELFRQNALVENDLSLLRPGSKATYVFPPPRK